MSKKVSCVTRGRSFLRFGKQTDLPLVTQCTIFHQSHSWKSGTSSSTTPTGNGFYQWFLGPFWEPSLKPVIEQPFFINPNHESLELLLATHLPKMNSINYFWKQFRKKIFFHQSHICKPGTSSSSTLPETNSITHSWDDFCHNFFSPIPFTSAVQSRYPPQISTN